MLAAEFLYRWTDKGMPTLEDVTAEVRDEETFLLFLKALRKDWEDLGGTWENPTLDRFLEAAVAWAEDSQDAPMLGTPSENPWRRCAEILRAGARYE
jgi:hypothetical protein